MSSAIGNPAVAADLLDTQGTCTAPLDAAAEYLRRRIELMFPLYLLGMLPHAMVTAWLIDAICSERRSLVSRYCIYLVAATLWRWVWLARMQWQMQKDLQIEQTSRFWSKLPAIILFRLLGSFAITWGSFLAAVPSFYGLFIGSFAAPALLESTEPALTRLKQMASWVRFSAKRLAKILAAMSVIALLLLIAILVNQSAIANLVMPNLLGMDTADLNVTIQSWPWRLGAVYLVFLLLDGFWTVASVFLYYDSQSRRMATDLGARLASITGEMG